MSRIKSFVFQNRLIFVIILFVLAYLCYQIKDIVLLFYASFVIASALNPIVDIMNKKMHRGLAVALIYLIGFLILAGVLVPLSFVVGHQLILFLKQVPGYWAQLVKMTDNWMLIGKDMGLLHDSSQIMTTATGWGQNILNKSIDITVNSLAGFVITFTLAMIVLYMLLYKNKIKESFVSFFPKEARERVDVISSTISKKVGGYLIGQILLLIAVAILITLGFSLIGLNFSVLLGFIAGILDIIPVVGPILATIIAVLVALAQKPILAVWVIVIFIIVQWFVNAFLKPLIMGKFLDLHPLIIIFAIFVAANFLGIEGVVLSPAIAATICVLIQELYLKTINNENE